MVTRRKHEVAVAIMRRRAAMSRAVVPRRTAWEEWFLARLAEQPPTDVDRTCELDAADEMDEASSWWAKRQWQSSQHGWHEEHFASLFSSSCLPL